MPTELQSATVGEDAPYQFGLYDSDGDPITGYTSAATFLVEVWAGDDQGVLFQPAAAWADGTCQAVNVTIAGSQTAALAAGIYRILGRVSQGGVSSDFVDGLFPLRPSPGSASAPNVYCTEADMRLHAAWIDRLASTTFGQAGYASLRGRAREWLDDIILRSFRSTSISSLNAYPCSAYWGGNYHRTGLANPYILGLLRADQLLVTAKVREACALYSLHLLCAGQVSTAQEGQGYARLADRFMAMAESAVACLTAELDTNGDGLGDLAVDLGTPDTFWA
jgi:hypothetical protein